ncbi:MAG: FHA domain-containing protein [bacterium]|nr:FHA domain-containing protein [bacterium]
MALDAELLSILACPRCKGELHLREKTLVCSPCKTFYEIKEGVPILVPEKAKQLKEVSETPTDSGKRLNKLEARVLFEIVEGKENGQQVALKLGTCKAIGRSLESGEQTKVFNIDSVASLDDFSKKLVINYVSQQFQGKEKGASPTGDLGSFKRVADWPLDDEAVSRLHAMIFFGETGVGILDLVSKNGTYINGTEVESQLLKNNDLITIGGTKIRYQSS